MTKLVDEVDTSLSDILKNVDFLKVIAGLDRRVMSSLLIEKQDAVDGRYLYTKRLIENSVFVLQIGLVLPILVLSLCPTK